MKKICEAIAAALAGALMACGGGSGTSATSPASPTNTPPVAVAGIRQYVQTGSSVTLDATASTDIDGDPLAYAWTLRAEQPGNAPILNNPTSARPTFVADTYQPGAAYTATVTVSDGKASTTASVPIVATQPGVTLIEVDLFGQELPAGFPYDRRPTQNITTSDPIVTLARYKLVVQGPGQFTVHNLGVGLSAGGIVPSFSGLADGQVLTAGAPVVFALQSTHTMGSTVYTMDYKFDIAEVPFSRFDYRSALKTN